MDSKNETDTKSKQDDSNTESPPSPPPSYSSIIPTQEAQPPEYTVVEPSTLILEDETIYTYTNTPSSSSSSSAPSKTPLYRLSLTVTAVTQSNSSIRFERITPADKTSEEGTHLLYYLVHPQNARFRTDVPPYYITSTKRPNGNYGNIRIDCTKSILYTEVKALLSAGRCAEDLILFAEGKELVMFTGRTKRIGGRTNWLDARGDEIAYEDGPRLVITREMYVDARDALVATWCLRVWRDTNETLRARYDELERLTPPEAFLDTRLNKANKRAAAFGALGAIGGG